MTHPLTFCSLLCLLVQQSYCLLAQLIRGPYITLGAADLLVAKQMCDGVDVNASVKKHLGECVTETMEGDVFPDACLPDELRDLLIEDRDRQTWEDTAFLFGIAKNCPCLVSQRKPYFDFSFLYDN